MYDVKSMKAEEFIDHEEILETLKFAEENKNNFPLINEILEKAKPKKYKKDFTCEGLSHREALVLLFCEDVEKIIPKDILFTSFSILVARYRGDLKTLISGKDAIKK